MYTLYINKHTHKYITEERKVERKKEKKERKKNNHVVSSHIQVCKQACVIIIESEMKNEFSPESPPLICVSVSQSDLCQEVNAVRA